MGTIKVIAPEPIEAITAEKQARERATPGWLERIELVVSHMVITGDTEAENAGILLRQSIREQEQMREVCREPKSKAYAAWKALCALEEKLTAPYARIELKLRNQIALWDREKKRQAALQQAALDKLATTVRKDLEVQARQRAREGDIDAARQLREQAALTSAPQLPEARIQIDGIGLREDYEIEITDVKAFCAAVGSGQIPTEAVEIKLPWLRKQARSMAGLEYPGVLCREVKKVRVTR